MGIIYFGSKDCRAKPRAPLPHPVVKSLHRSRATDADETFNIFGTEDSTGTIKAFNGPPQNIGRRIISFKREHQVAVIFDLVDARGSLRIVQDDQWSGQPSTIIHCTADQNFVAIDWFKF